MKRQKHSKWMGILIFVAFIMVMGWAFSESWAAEAKYPNRVIQLVIPFPPGPADILYRVFTERFPEYLGQPATIVYKPGAAGAIGTVFVAKAKPDGYTLIAGASSPLIYGPLAKEGLDYTLNDFVPICRLCKIPMMILVKTDSPWKTLKDIVEEAKKFPGKLTYASTGVFSNSHVAMERFFQSAGISMTHVPTAGTAPVVTALLGGHVDIGISTPGTITPHTKSGTLRPIAVFEKERIKEFPDVPTFSEWGYPVVCYSLYAIMAPKGTPEEVVKTIYTACKRIVEDHKNSIQDQLAKLSLSLDFLPPEELANDLKAENEVVKRIIEDIKKSIK